MVLVDSALWVSAEHRFVDLEELADGDTVAICPAIVQELLQGATTRRQEETTRALVESLTVIDSPTPRERFEHAAQLYAATRKLGFTITGYDCLIAASAIANDALLLHADVDFQVLARVAPELRQQRV